MKDSVGDKSATIGSGEIAKDYVASQDAEVGGENGKGDADPESFSDIDDVEVDGYLHNEEETQYKKIIWEEMNKEYLEEQAAKEALAAELAARGVGVGEGQQKVLLGFCNPRAELCCCTNDIVHKIYHVVSLQPEGQTRPQVAASLRKPPGRRQREKGSSSHSKRR